MITSYYFLQHAAIVADFPNGLNRRFSVSAGGKMPRRTEDKARAKVV